MASDGNKTIESILGYSRAKTFASLKDSESKRIIETVLDFAKQSFQDLDRYQGLVLGHSNSEIERFQSYVERLDLEKLKITLDLAGFADVPDDWLELARFLLKAERGKSYECSRYLSNLAKMIIFKITGHFGDKDFLRTFHKVPAGQLLRFFKKYRVEEHANGARESSHGQSN